MAPVTPVVAAVRAAAPDTDEGTGIALLTGRRRSAVALTTQPWRIVLTGRLDRPGAARLTVCGRRL